MDRLRHEGLAGTGRVGQARGEVHRFARDREGLLPGSAARHHLTAGDADMDAQLPARGLAQTRHQVVDRERGADRPLGVVAVGDRRAEDAHDAVADVLVDRAAVALDHAVDGFEEAAHELVQLLRVEFAAEPGIAGEIGEQHRDLPALGLR